MAKINFKGLDDYIRALNRMKGDETATIEKSVYMGAKVIGDAVKSGMSGVRTREDGHMYRNGEMAPGPTEQEKRDMIASFGLAPMRNDSGYINTKAGFDGYGSHKTKSFKQGVPNALVARSCESGTSWMRKQPFMRKAVNGSKQAAISAMKAKFDDEIKKQMN